jgi:type II secretory pathway component GspD/PulD (secretin)
MRQRVSHEMSRPRGAALVALAQALVLSAALPMGASLAAVNVGAGPSARSERKVRLDFVQADVNDVAKALSIQSGVNVVLMPSVKGNLTLRLIDLTFEDALQKTASAVGADVRKIDNTYFLGSTAELRAMVARTGRTQTVGLRYAQAQNAKNLVLAGFPYLTAEAAGNALVLTGSEEDLTAAVQMVREHDVVPFTPPTPEPPKPVVVKDTYTLKFASAGPMAQTLRQALPEVEVSHVDRTLVLQGTAEQQKLAAKLIGSLDVQGAGERTIRCYTLKHLHPHQTRATLKGLFPTLSIEAGFDTYSPAAAKFRPISVETEKAFKTESGGGGEGGNGGGGNGGGGNGGGGGGGSVSLDGPGNRSRDLILAGPRADVEAALELLGRQDAGAPQVLIEARVVDISPEKSKQLGFLYDWSSFSLTETVRPGREPWQFGPWGRAPFNWQVTLEAMEERRDAKVLAKPNIAVIDGEEASIFIGDILRYERLESVTAVGQTFTIETVPVGVALLVRPRVTAGEITLRVHPVVSTIAGFTGRNQDIPITSSREAETVLRMRDGETIAIGGLMREEELKIMTKIPILGDLPFFGQLFRHRNNSKKKSEVTIFLTAKILPR